MIIRNKNTGHALKTDHLPGQKKPVLIIETMGIETVLARFKSQNHRDLFDAWLNELADLGTISISRQRQ